MFYAVYKGKLNKVDFWELQGIEALKGRNIMWRRRYYYSKMQKGRNELSSTNWQSTHSTPAYLDSAYKELLRQDIKAVALQNRSKVLNLNHDHLLKQAENNQQKLSRLLAVKDNHSLQVQKLRQDRQKKTALMEEQKVQNSRKRQNHKRQMSNASLEKTEHLTSLKKEALELRKENTRLIEINREAELQKKKQIRNKIHNDILQSRTTVKQFFSNKHSTIVESNQQEIRRINERRINQQKRTIAESGPVIGQMEKQIRQLKKDMQEGREVAPRIGKNELKGRQEEETHPLLKRIDNVMSRYTKIY